MYVPGGALEEESRLVWIDRKGASSRWKRLRARISGSALKPIAAAWRLPSAGALRMCGFATCRGTPGIRLPPTGASFLPVWTHNGERVTFSSSRGGVLTGTDTCRRERRHRAADTQRIPAISTVLVGRRQTALSSTVAFPPPLLAGGTATCCHSRGSASPGHSSRTAENDIHATFSPDGRFVAYAHDEAGGWKIYVVPFPDPVARWPISTESGTHPVWARNGRELFYRNGVKIMAVDVTTQPAFRAGTPRLLFEERRDPSGRMRPTTLQPMVGS